MRKLIFSFFVLLGTFPLVAQEFQYKALLPEIDSSYFYNIFLPPEVTSKLNYKFSDIRIYNKKGKEIPFIRDTEENRFKTTSGRKLKIIQNEHKPAKKYTLVLIHDPDKRKISNFVLTVKNIDAEYWLHISGSNDLKTWHILKSNTRYQPEFSDSSTTKIIIDDLPETNYEYYRILVYDYNRVPLPVIDVYSYALYKRNVSYVEVPKPHFVQDDSTEANRTIVKISFDQPQYIDKIEFIISAPEYYLRKAELTKRDTLTGRKIRLQYYDQKQKDFYLCSDSSNILTLSRYYAKDLYLIVENNNDEPLKFSDVRAYQKKEYLIAYLNKGQKYHIEFGNKNVPEPIYDLKYFKDKIPSDRPEITVGKVIKILTGNARHTQMYIQPLYLWIALGVIVLFLVLISVKVFRSVKRNDL